MKRKNEDKSWKAIFIKENGGLQDIWEFLLVFAGIALLLAGLFLVAVVYETATKHTPMENYTEQYEACMATERFTQYQCHEIGIEAMGL